MFSSLKLSPVDKNVSPRPSTRPVRIAHVTHREGAGQPPEVLLRIVAELPNIERRTEPSARAPALSFDGQLDLRGVSKVRADARSPLAVVAVVLIVLFIVAGVVLVARSSGTRREEPRREDLGRCIERIEVIEMTCTRDGS